MGPGALCSGIISYICGGQHRGVFGCSSGFSTNLVGMVLVLVANAICISIDSMDSIKKFSFQSMQLKSGSTCIECARAGARVLNLLNRMYSALVNYCGLG